MLFLLALIMQLKSSIIISFKYSLNCKGLSIGWVHMIAWTCRLALHNTRLLQLYTRVHPPLVDLMLVIRYWAKMRQLAGNPVSGPRLTNYALGFLVIFYLQNSQPPALPDVQTLAHMAGQCCNSLSCKFETL